VFYIFFNHLIIDFLFLALCSRSPLTFYDNMFPTTAKVSFPQTSIV